MSIRGHGFSNCGCGLKFVCMLCGPTEVTGISKYTFILKYFGSTFSLLYALQRKAPKKLMNFHSGEINGLDCSPITYQAASISQNGQSFMYNCYTCIYFQPQGISLALESKNHCRDSILCPDSSAYIVATPFSLYMPSLLV